MAPQGCSKWVLGYQEELIRGGTLYFADTLSKIQAHYLSTVIVTTLSESLLFGLFCGLYFAMRAFPMWVSGADYEQAAQMHANTTIQLEVMLGLHVEKQLQVWSRRMTVCCA